MNETVNKTIEDRKNSHGSWIEGALVAQQLKGILSANKHLRSHSVNEALDRICMKLSRIVAGNADEPDHWHDIAGYATLVEKDLNSEDI